MKKTLKQYIEERYSGSVSEMAKDWGLAESSLRRQLSASKPVHVYRDKAGRLTIESELASKGKN